MPVQAICDIAETGEFSLVVVGSGGHGRIAGILLGRVSDAALHETQVPVITV